MDLFNDTNHTINFLLYKMEAGKAGWGVNGRGREKGERDRAEWIKGIGDRVQERKTEMSRVAKRPMEKTP